MRAQQADKTAAAPTHLHGGLKAGAVDDYGGAVGAQDRLDAVADRHWRLCAA